MEPCNECGTFHANYPHTSGTLYDCYACETQHHASAGDACVCDLCLNHDYV